MGVIHQGGPYRAVVDGLRDGLRQLGYQDGNILLEIRDTKADLKLVEEAARTFESERVNLIYAVTTSVATPVKNVTSKIPIVFSVGSDPVASGLVQSFGNLEGDSQVFSTQPRISRESGRILKEILPKLNRVVTFYIPTTVWLQRPLRWPARQPGSFVSS